MIELTLPTMTCGHCVRTVTQAVQRIDASASVTVDLPTHHVKIQSLLPREAFLPTLAEEGYVPG